MRTFWIAVTRSGDTLPPLLLIGLLLAFGPLAWRVRAILLLAGDLLSLLITQLIKTLVRRQRPAGDFGAGYRRIDPHSFPSGHASRGGMMAALALWMGPWWFALFVMIWGPLLALSRVFVGVHYMADALAGFVFGVAVAGIVLLLAINVAAGMGLAPGLAAVFSSHGPVGLISR